MESLMITSNAMAATLETLIESEAFAPQLEAYLNRTIRRERMSWYARTLATEGRNAAERQLTAWVRQNHYDVRSSCLEPLAGSIVALAKAKNGSLVDITNWATNLYSNMNKEYGPQHKFIMMNPLVPCCGCPQPEGSHTWAPNGEIALKAVILETGYTHNGQTAAITLVLPTWARSGLSVGTDTAFLMRIGTDGSSWGHRYTLSVPTEESWHEIDDDVRLQYLLGMKLDEDMEQTIGFPGAENYLATKLPELGYYFGALAEKFSTSHEH
jgi:hypothetical protein